MKKENINIEKRLKYLKNENVFKVPDNYFEDFAGRLKTRIVEEVKPAARLSWTDLYLRPALGITAVFAILFMAIYIPISKTFKEQKVNITYSNKSANINSNKTGTEQGDLEALMLMPQSQFLSALEEVETSGNVPTIDPQALEDYLAENTIDYDLLTSN